MSFFWRHGFVAGGMIEQQSTWAGFVFGVPGFLLFLGHFFRHVHAGVEVKAGFIQAAFQDCQYRALFFTITLKPRSPKFMCTMALQTNAMIPPTIVATNIFIALFRY
jgi:hypothetical protein